MTTLNSPDLLDITVANFRGLKALDSLSPGADTDRMFGSLVNTARAPLPLARAETLLAEVDENIGLGQLHMLCAEGEFAMETYWAERIKNASNPKRELKAFPYWGNYLKLAALEVKAIRKLMPEAKKILFVGGGPLPLSAFIMAKNYGLDVTNMDISRAAIDCAMDWMGPVLGNMEIPCIHTDVNDFTAFGEYDVVIMAALVGLDKAAKRKVTAHLHQHMGKEQLLMVRSVRGLRALLYPKVVADDLMGFDVVKEVHPRGEVINSVMLARKS
jgi:2-polyprenyl-3-methyl-5-hydroxy-6-metoxy-1,4-benzoquinol methylase